MPSVRYYNQTAPFWDFVAGLEDRGASHPFFADARGEEPDSEGQGSHPWGFGWGGWGGSHRGRHHGHHPHHHHQDHDGEQPSAPHAGPSEPRPPPKGEKDGENNDPPESVPGDVPPPPPPGYHHHPPPPPPPPHMIGFSGRCGRGGCGRRGRGGWGGGQRMGAGPFALNGFAEFINSQFLGNNDNSAGERGEGQQEDFKPEADVFDTESSFVVHVSLPGAKKDDVGVSWDAEKSELSVGGVVHRPGDEDFLKTLAMDERKIGAFEKKIRLGSRANPAQVDADMITAKMEDGVLQVTVPKLDKDYVEIKKVEVE